MARRFERNAWPTAPNPKINSIQIPGSGTAVTAGAPADANVTGLTTGPGGGGGDGGGGEDTKITGGTGSKTGGVGSGVGSGVTTAARLENPNWIGICGMDGGDGGSGGGSSLGLSLG